MVFNKIIACTLSSNFKQKTQQFRTLLQNNTENYIKPLEKMYKRWKFSKQNRSYYVNFFFISFHRKKRKKKHKT